MMLRRQLLLFLIIVLGYQEQISAEQYNLRKAIEAVGFIVPVPGNIIKKGLKAFDIFSKILDSLSGVPTEPSVSKQLAGLKENTDKILQQNYKNEQKIDDLKELIPVQVQIDFQIREIFKLIETVDTIFDNFVHDVLRFNLSKKTLLDKAHKFVSERSNGRIAQKLDDIKIQLETRKTSLALLNLLGNKKQASQMMCTSKQSSMHLLNVLYNDIVKAEIKGLIIAKWSYNELKTETYDYGPEIDSYVNTAERRIIRISKNMKEAMKNAGRDFWLCDPYPKILGKNYDTLDPFIRSHIFPEPDAGEMRDNKLFRYKQYEDCGILGEKQRLLDLCESNFCKQSEGKCNGFVRGCYLHDKGSNMDVCLADPKVFGRRKYLSVKIDNTRYGSTDKCNYRSYRIEGINHGSDIVGAIALFWSFSVPYKDLIHKTDNCICTCDADRDIEQVRYFSLRELAVSDIHQNKVVTGARIVKQNLQIHIEIQQATLLENGNIDQETANWKHINYRTSIFPVVDDSVPGVHFHKLTWKNRQVNIDLLDAPSGSALTGLRFEVEDGHVKLGIRYTPFDFASGKLNPNQSVWKSEPNNIKKNSKSNKLRQEIKFNTALPTNSEHTLDPRDNTFIKFTTSSFENDVGQSVVPFFDLQSLTSKPISLLSGAGLVYRESPTSAGFLALKLYTYDFEPHFVIPTGSSRKFSVGGNDVIVGK